MRFARVAWIVLLGFALVFGMTVAAHAEGVPVEPGNAAPDAFMPAEACTCHGALVDEWSRSMHSQAMTDPIYNAKVEEGDKATNGALGPFCRKCHAPAATMTGEIAQGSMSGPNATQGVFCHFCHQVSGIQPGEPGNTSHLVTTDGTRRAQIKDPKAPHAAAYSQLHETAEFCGGCHNVNHPVNGMHLESTYREWAAGPYAKEGVKCQDCHMSEKVGVRGPSTGEAAVGAPTRDNIYHMTFVGAQVGLGDAEAATALLKSAAKVELEAPEIVAAGDVASVTVSITNEGAGHYLPTGLTEVRQMWLEVTAEGPDGQPEKIGERRFETILKDDTGRYPVELWDATGVQSDDRIPPRETVTSSFSATMPADTDVRTIKAALFYKSVPDELAEKAGVDNPTTEMAAASRVVYASEAAKAAGKDAAADSAPSAPSPVLLIALVAAAGAIGVGAWAVSKRSNSEG